MATTPYLPLMAGDGMWFMLFLVAVGFLYVAVCLLHLASPAAVPTLYYKQSANIQKIITQCQLLSEPYVPPLLWGKSGHFQTIVYGKLGRVKTPFPRGERCYVTMSDDATLSYDVFEPLKQHPHGDFTIIICPGIANSSESLYVCTFVDYAQNHGYRVAVLNHLGALKDVRLTAPRIFTYGSTDEYGAMVDQVIHKYPQSKLLACGFSMGGNIILKYLGEKPERQQKFLAAMSCCQGYNAERAVSLLMTWYRCRRVYLWAMTQHQKKLLRHHYNELFGPESHKKHGRFDVERIFKATSLVELDEIYSRRRAGYSNLEEYYRDSSCAQVMDNINIPLFLLNTRDDPIVPYHLVDIAKEYALKKDNILLCVTEHGGHLGFFEGGAAIPDTITWLDKIVIEYADAISAQHCRSRPAPSVSPVTSSSSQSTFSS